VKCLYLDKDSHFLKETEILSVLCFRPSIAYSCVSELPFTSTYNRKRSSYEANSRPARHGIPLILRNPRIHHKNAILDSTLSQINPVHILNAHFLGPFLNFENRVDANLHVSCSIRVDPNFVHRIHLCVSYNYQNKQQT
jgi:hypothetical protein